MKFRKERIEEQVRSVIAQFFHFVPDDELSLLTILQVEMSKDYRYAKVFWSISIPSDDDIVKFPTEAKIKMISEILVEKAPQIQRRIADSLQLRNTPKLQFHYDASMQAGNRIDELLKKAGL